ncbi:ubiquitin-like protein, partial [Aureobasidium namibiae CBS 147.97]
DMPMTMAASVVLDHLPRDAHTALAKAGLLEQDKILLHFRPGPSTPPLPRNIQKYKMSSSLHFDAIIKFLRKKLQLQNHESVFCYVNQVFAPGLDEGVGNLWRCFRTGEELVVTYCLAQSFG